MRRHQSENVDSDPIVWTNQRFVKWVRSIDLGEYADNLKGELGDALGFATTLNTEYIICNIIVLLSRQIAEFMAASC